MTKYPRIKQNGNISHEDWQVSESAKLFNTTEKSLFYFFILTLNIASLNAFVTYLIYNINKYIFSVCVGK